MSLNNDVKGSLLLDRQVLIMDIYIDRVRREPMNTLLQSEAGMPVLCQSTLKKGAVATHWKTRLGLKLDIGEE